MIPPKELHAKAIDKFATAATELGARLERFYPRDIHRITEFDAVFIRADTDPRNMTYAVARYAEAHGIPVLDHADSIAICCNKIHMGRLLQKAGVPTPPTRYLLKTDARSLDPETLFQELGSPLVLKAPTSSFSAFVEKVNNAEEYRRVARRFLRRTDGLVVQRFTPTTFDWRVVTVGGRVISVCRYWMPSGAWRVHDHVEGQNGGAQRQWGKVEGVPMLGAPKELLRTAKKAAAAIGTSLYGVDLKETEDGRFLVIEVNDNPTILPGYEDQAAPRLYEDIVRNLLEASH